jgi:hypothetical protein
VGARGIGVYLRDPENHRVVEAIFTAKPDKFHYKAPFFQGNVIYFFSVKIPLKAACFEEKKFTATSKKSKKEGKK